MSQFKTFLSFLWFAFGLCPWLSHAAPWELSHAQGLLGIQTTDADWTIKHEQGSSTSARDDLIYLGGLAQYGKREGLLQYGFEAGGLFTIQNDINYFFITNGGLELEIAAKNDFWALDLFAGGYLSINPSTNLRLYAAVGPALVLGSLYIGEDDVEISPFDNEGSNFSLNLGGRQSATDLGLYGRIGIDLLPVQDITVGISARKIKSELDFNNNGVITLDDTQYFLTFTRRY